MAEIVALYKLTLDRPPHNFPPRCNVCPTDPVDTIVAADGKRELYLRPSHSANIASCRSCSPPIHPPILRG
jgi:hypothetical protein